MILIADDASYVPATESGDFERSVSVSRGLAKGDIDRDGDLALVVTGIAGPVEIYRNDTVRGGSWVIVDAVMGEPARPAIGAVITVNAEARSWSRAARRGGSYLSSSPPAAHFGLGETERLDSIEVRWPDGLVESFEGGAVNRRVLLTRGEGGAQR